MVSTKRSRSLSSIQDLVVFLWVKPCVGCRTKVCCGFGRKLGHFKPIKYGVDVLPVNESLVLGDLERRTPCFVPWPRAASLLPGVSP